MAEDWYHITNLDGSETCEMGYGTHGNMHLWTYINQALLCINMDENWDCSRTSSKSLPYRV
jgi:hypothetical protein